MKIKTNCSNCGESDLCVGSNYGFTNLCQACIAEFTSMWARATRLESGAPPDPNGPTNPPAGAGTILEFKVAKAA